MSASAFVFAGLIFAWAPTQANLRVDGERCFDRAELVTRVAARLGYDPFVEEAALRLVVRVASAGSTATLEVRSTGPEVRERKLSGSSCSSLAETVALAVALVVDPIGKPAPVLVPGAELPALAPVPTPEPVPAVIALAPIEKGEPAPVPAPLGVETRLVGLFVAGVTPGAAGGVEWSMRAQGTRWSLGADLSLLVPSSARLSIGSVNATSAWLGLAGCLRLSVFEGCVVGRGGLGWFQGEALAVNRTASAPLGTISLRVGAQFPAEGRVFGTAAAEAGLSLSRVSLSVDGLEAWRMPAFSGRFSLGVGLRL